MKLVPWVASQGLEWFLGTQLTLMKLLWSPTPEFMMLRFINQVFASKQVEVKLIMKTIDMPL